MTASEKLAHYWSLEGLTPQSGATLDAVSLFEQAHRVLVPEDFREYLLNLNGLMISGSGVDRHGFGFWPLQRIRPVAPSEYPPLAHNGRYFVFADYLGWSWAYAICFGECEARGQIIHISTLEARVVADSFTTFVDLYIADAPELYPSGIPND